MMYGRTKNDIFIVDGVYIFKEDDITQIYFTDRGLYFKIQILVWERFTYPGIFRVEKSSHHNILSTLKLLHFVSNIVQVTKYTRPSDLTVHLYFPRNFACKAFNILREFPYVRN